MKKNNTTKANRYLQFLIKTGVFIVLVVGIFGQEALSQADGNVYAEHLQEFDNVNLEEILVSVDFNETYLDEAFLELGAKSGVTFNYSGNIFPDDEKITYKVENTSMSEVLQSILPAGVEYKVVRNVVILQESGLEENEEAYQETVTGQVVDAESGETLPGVNIYIEGTTIGTSTDVEGEFTIDVPDLNQTLVFSYIGYETKQIEIDGRTNFTVSLNSETVYGEELVVVGYGTMRREDITSSVSSVSMENFNTGIAINPLDMIQGRVAGLTISRTGFDPNAGLSIQLRGLSSIEGGKGPLIVVDGIPGANLENLPYAEIESIDVLKDGSAAAIYGTRGTNGVIHVTTKSANTENTQFSYQGSLQTERISNRLDVLSADQYRDLIAEGRISENQDFGHSTDWFDEILRTPFTQNQNFSIMGGGTNTSYRASINYTDAKPIMIETGRESYGGRLNIDHTGLNDILNVLVNLQTTFVENNYGTNSVSEQAIIRNPTSPVYNSDGSDEFFDPIGIHNQFNPVARLKQREDGAERTLILGSVKGILSLTDWLETSLFYARENNTQKNFVYVPRNAFESRSSDYDGLAWRRDRFWVNNTLDFTIEAVQDFNTHRFNVLGGYSYQDFSFEDFSAENRDFITDATSWYDLGGGNFLSEGRASMHTYKESSKLIAFFGRLNYSYDNKYLITGSVRHEGSSKFGANNKWGTFPAVSLGWRISNEEFMNNIGFIDNLLLRLGYGKTGNQDFSSYQSLVTLRTYGDYYDHETGSWLTGWGPAQNPNPNLQWESKKELNLGVDFDLLEGKVNGNLDLFSRTTENLLFNYDAPTPPSVRSQIFTNVGSIENSGIEAFINVRLVNKKDFQWNSTFNTSFLRNKVVSLSNEFYEKGFIEMANLPAPGSLGPSMRIEEGQRLGSFYGWEHAGFTDDGNWLFYKEDGSTATPEDMSRDDRTFIGNGLPKMNAGWSNNFSYKNWDLSVFFRGEFFYDILNMTPMYYANNATLASYNQLTSVLDEYAHINAPAQFSDYYLERGDYIKLDNLTIGYSFDLTKYSIRNLRVYATSRNLLTITNYSGLDPEVGSTGLQPGIDGRSFYPRTTTFSLGVNIEF